MFRSIVDAIAEDRKSSKDTGLDGKTLDFFCSLETKFPMSSFVGGDYPSFEVDHHESIFGFYSLKTVDGWGDDRTIALSKEELEHLCQFLARHSIYIDDDY